jgi:transposase-like protein
MTSMKKYALLLPKVYQNAVINEAESRFFLRTLRFTRRVVICPRCKNEIPGLFQSGNKKVNRYRCPGCGYRFSDFSDTLLSSNKIPWSRLIVTVHLFITGKSARQTAFILKMNYKSARALFHKIRWAIYQHYHQRNALKIVDAGKRIIYLKPQFARYIKNKPEPFYHGLPSNELLYLKEQAFRFTAPYKPEVLTDVLRWLLTPLQHAPLHEP